VVDLGCVFDVAQGDRGRIIHIEPRKLGAARWAPGQNGRHSGGQTQTLQRFATGDAHG